MTSLVSSLVIQLWGGGFPPLPIFRVDGFLILLGVLVAACAPPPTIEFPEVGTNYIFCLHLLNALVRNTLKHELVSLLKNIIWKLE